MMAIGSGHSPGGNRFTLCTFLAHCVWRPRQPPEPARTPGPLDLGPDPPLVSKARRHTHGPRRKPLTLRPTNSMAAERPALCINLLAHNRCPFGDFWE